MLNWIFSKFPKPLAFIKDLISDHTPYNVASWVVFVTVVNLNLGTYLLIRAAINGKAVSVELVTVTGALLTLVGYSYGKDRTVQPRVNPGPGVGVDVVEGPKG